MHSIARPASARKLYTEPSRGERMKTGLGELPVIGTLRQCTLTETGWCGIDDAGVVIEVGRRPGDITAAPATIPCGNRIVKFENERAVGVFVLKRKRKLA
jgi:hypothetical protein